MQIAELMKRFGVGLTGGIACGKSTVAKVLENLGYPVIDADTLARKAVAPGTKGLAAIVSAFGGAILTGDGQLNRAMMAELIFNEPNKKKQLESIVHPVIHELLEQELTDRGLLQFPRVWFYEATLLFETGSATKYFAVWTVSCPRATQLARLQKRDHRDPRLLAKIVDSQMPSKVKASKSDFVIDTSCPIEELETKVRLGLESLQKRVQTASSSS